MISLSAYGQPPNNLYAAVWVQRSGPSYYAIHEATASEFQTFFNTHSSNGYVSTIITATGSGSNAIFSGIMEQNGVTNWYQKCGMTYDQYVDELINSQLGNAYILESFTEYGSASNRQYCGIWYHNDQQATYTDYLDETYSEYQSSFDLQAQNNFHPDYLSVSEDHMIVSKFVNTNIGPWVSFYGMTASALQAQYETQLAAGRYIIHLQGGGTGSNTNFAAIWAQTDIPI